MRGGQLKLSAAAASSREKLPTYTPVSTEGDAGAALNGRYNSFGDQGVTHASPRASLKAEN